MTLKGYFAQNKQLLLSAERFEIKKNRFDNNLLRFTFSSRKSLGGFEPFDLNAVRPIISLANLEARTVVNRDLNPEDSVTRLDNFYLLGNKISYKSSTNIPVNFWTILNNFNFLVKMIWLFFGQFWEKLGNFLFHHPVTLRQGLLSATSQPQLKSLLPTLNKMNIFRTSFHKFM